MCFVKVGVNGDVTDAVVEDGVEDGVDDVVVLFDITLRLGKSFCLGMIVKV